MLVRNSGDVIVSNRKVQFAPGFVVSALRIIQVVCVAFLVGLIPSRAAQIASGAASCSVQSTQAPNVDKAAIIEIQCSGVTPDEISLTAAGATSVIRKLSDSDTSANYLLSPDKEPANTAGNTVVPAGKRPDTVRVTVTY